MADKLRIIRDAGSVDWGDGPVCGVTVLYKHEGRTYALPFILDESFLESDECEAILEAEMLAMIHAMEESDGDTGRDEDGSNPRGT